MKKEESKPAAENIYRSFDTTFQLISKILLSAIKRLSPYAIAILPGSIFGYTIFEFFLQLSGLVWLSVIVGFSGFVALESAGIWAGNKIAEFYGDGTRKIVVPIIAFTIYLIIGIGTLWFLDGFVPLEVQIVGTSLFLLAGVIYTLFGFQAYQERLEAKESREKRDEVLLKIQDENRAFEMEEAKKDRALERQIKKKKALAGIETEIAIKPKRESKVRSGSPSYDEEKMNKLIELLAVDEKTPRTELAKQIGVSRMTLYRYLRIIKEGDV